MADGGGGGIKFVWPPVSIGWLIALVILIVVIILAIIGQMRGLEVWLIGGLALARLT